MGRMHARELLEVLIKHEKHDCRKLILASKAQMHCFLAYQIGRRDPLVFMEVEAQRPCMSHLRLSLRWMVEGGYPLIPPPAHHSGFCLEEMYRPKLKGKLALARGSELSEARFTFHLVTRLILLHATPSERAYYQKRADKHGGEAEIHKFISFSTAREALLFFQLWRHVRLFVRDVGLI